MVYKIIGLLFVLTFSIGIYISKNIGHKWIHKQKIASFSAGVIISYLFLKLLPELFYLNIHKTSTIYLLLLLGFSLIHLIEKYIYQHTEDKVRLKFEHQKAHETFFFIYYAVLAVLIVFFSSINIISAALFTTTIIFYSVIKSISTPKKDNMNGFLYIAPLLGFIFSILFPFTTKLFIAILSIITGSIFYLVTRELIPSGRKGKPVYFVLGILFYIITDSLFGIIAASTANTL